MRKELLPQFARLVLVSALTTSSWAQVSPADERYRGALNRIGAEDYQGAIQLLESVVAETPTFAPAYVSLSDAYVYAGDLLGGRRYFERLLEENPNSPFAHYGLARIELEEDNVYGALERLKRSIAIEPSFTEGYRQIVEVYEAMGDLEGAVRFFEEVIEERGESADAYFGLARSHRRLFDSPRALSSLQQALRLDPEHTSALSEEIALDGTSGRFREALETARKLGPIARARGELDRAAFALRTESLALYYLGDFWKALETGNEALSIAEEIGDRREIGRILVNVASLYDLVGDFRRSRELNLAALKLAREGKDVEAEALLLSNLGLGATDRGELDLAQAYLEESLELTTNHGLRAAEGYTLLNLANLLSELGDERGTEETLQRAALVSQEVGDSSLRSAVFSDLSALKYELREYVEAEKCAAEALRLATETQDAEAIWRARGRMGLALERQGKIDEAIAHFRETIRLYGEARDNLGIVSMGVDFLQSNDLAFPPMIRLLGTSGRYEEAFQYAEKYKATSLLALLSEARGVVEELLPESTRADLERISEQLEAAHSELSSVSSRGDADEELGRTLERRITDLEVQRESLLVEMKREQPAYFRLASTEPQAIDDIRSRNLRPNQTLIEYVVGKEDLSIFVLTRDELAYKEVSLSKAELERMLVALSPVFRRAKPASEASRQQAFSPALAGFSIPPARALYDALLGPVEAWISEGTELVIVPDDILSYLPFEMLVVEAGRAENRYDFANATFLVEKHAVSYAASATLLDPNLQRARRASRGVLAFGNPDFSRRDEDLLSPEFLTASMGYAGSVVRDGEMVPLPKAESEAAAVARAVADSRAYVGKRASERAFKNEAEDYRVLHFATHFLNDDRQPLYSRIVLSQEEEDEEDGYLQTYEIFNTRLNADLVVLSACNTGLGKLSRGESLVGISRAFLYAGVPSLVVSLWTVDDDATSVLMKSFYEHLRTGANKRQALRQAKLDYLENASDDKRDPFYWAPFILVGDGSPLTLPEESREPETALLLGVILVLALLAGIAARLRRSQEPGA